MKLTLSLFIILFSQSLVAKSILLSGFDAFNNNKDNNSQIIAKILQKKFQGSDITIHYCQLRTVYNKSSETLQDCYHSLAKKPDYVISIGEGFCDRISFETMAFNEMNSQTADNDGVILYRRRILEDGPSKVRLSLNLKTIRSQLPRQDRKFVKMSKKIGTFVCNNLAYLVNSKFDQTPYGFIHVPSYNCKNQNDKRKRSIEILTKTINNLFN